MLTKRIIFMGTPKIAASYLQSLIDSEYNLVAVFSQPPRKKGRGMLIEQSAVHKLAFSHDIEVFTPTNLHSEEIRNNLLNLNPDLIIVMGYGLKIPKDILDIPKHGCVNIHVSLLPRWRGAAPIEHALLNGDKQTGITIFKLVEEMDAGPILTKISTLLDQFINNEELTSKLNAQGIKLMHTILPDIFNDKIIFKNQDLDQITYANKITTGMRKINFYNDAETIHNHIRAFSPKPSAWFIYNNERIKIIKSTFDKGDFETSCIVNKNFHIGCRNGKICPKIIQREGKQAMTVDLFLRGFDFEIGNKVNV